MVLAENRSECRVAGNIHSRAFWLLSGVTIQKAMLRRTLFSDRKLGLPVAWLPILVVPACTLRSPTAAIGTELLAHREKIEVTRLQLTI
jgi:hypothetical protein